MNKITFSRNEYRIRIRNRTDTGRPVIEIGKGGIYEQAGCIRPRLARALAMTLEYFTNGSDVIVIEKKDDAAD